MPKDWLEFSKEGRARYISHLDLMRTFQRAFLRADIAIKHTEGFNPHPFVSIALPLSLGFSSGCEFLEFGLLEGTDHADVPSKLNAALPEGITVHACYPAQRSIKELKWLNYRIEIRRNGDNQGLADAWSETLHQESWVIEKKSKKAKSGVTTLDVIPLVKEFAFSDISEDGCVLNAVLAAQNPGLNPSVLVNALTEKHAEFAPEFVSYRREQALDIDGKEFHGEKDC